MSASRQAKAAGLRSLRQVSMITGVSEQTLINWHNDKPKQFDITILGCVEKLKIDMEEDEKIAEAVTERANEIIDMLNQSAEEPGCTI